MKPCSSQTLPANMWADTSAYPFVHGVASGDPLADRVIIWTRIEPASIGNTDTVWWEIDSDSSFNSLIASGWTVADSSTDFTIKVDVVGLTKGSIYFYRFFDQAGRTSRTGRTKTASFGSTTQTKLAIASCSSVFSGFFNAYRRIAERNDVDLVVHLGDYIYDSVDPDEEVRIPIPFPTQPNNLQEWRDRHAYYLLDPDLRKARQQHPFSIMWDNHDIAQFNKEIPTQAFMEWTPTRQLDSTDHMKIYRKLTFGDLAEVFILDIDLYREIDSIAPGETSILGIEQYNWLTTELQNSTATWKIIGSQKMFSFWGVSILEPIVVRPGGVFSLETWDGFLQERQNLLSFIESQNIDNVIMVSGDSHVSVAAELAKDPQDSTQYDRETGQGSLGVEFLPSSISRGNFDEEGIDQLTLDILYQLNPVENPHHIYSEFTQHGYGLLDIKPDSTIAQYRYSEILNVSNSDTAGKEMVVLEGDNHWKRTWLGNSVSQNKRADGIWVSEVFPNPGNGQFEFRIVVDRPRTLQIDLLPATPGIAGNSIISYRASVLAEKTIQLKVNEFVEGVYVLQIQDRSTLITRKLVLMK